MSIIINDVNTRKEVDDLKDRVTTLENSGGSGSDKYLQNVELEHVSGGETIKPSNVTIASNNCNYTNSDYVLTLSNPTHEVQRTVEENGSIGVLSTAAAPANGTDAANYWFITQLPGFVPMIGKKIKSMTFKANTTGTVTFAGSTVAAGYTETNGTVIGNLYTQVKAAAQDMFTISATQGTSTYLFDGTDSRVTFLNNLTEFIMPTTLGVKRNVNCGIIHNNTGTNSLAPRTGENTDVLYGFIQNGSNPISYTASGYQSFAFDFVYEDTRTVEEDTGLRPVVTFTDEELIVESNGAGGYVIFAEGTDGYGVISGAGNVYWISKTTTDITQISGLDALAHAPVISLKLQNSSTLDVAYNDTMTTVLLPTVNNAFGNHTMDNFVLGYSRGLSQSDIVDGVLEYDFEGTYIENPSDRLIFTMNDSTEIIVDGLSSGGGSGTEVVANPVLAGSEPNLTGLEVAGSKYKVPQFELQSNLKGKKVSFIGDSITTYSGYLPSGNVTRYPRGVITNVNQTWWYQLIEQTGMVLGQNCSWDGSTCIGKSTSTTDAYGGCSAKRIGQLDDNGTPDIVICYIGINDWGAYYNNTGTHYGSPFTNGAFVPVGSYTGETAAPSGDLQTFSEAYGSMIYNIQVNYPNAKIYCCTLLHTNGKNNYHYDADGVFPSVNRDGVSLASYNECIKKLAANIGAEVIDFANCGINWGNLSTYLEDGLHPNIAGMQLLCAKAKAKLESDFGYTVESFTPAQTFSVTNNLTNVTNSNSASTASENSTYSANLAANTGYTISSVTITMGGTDITSSAYNNGVISISNVTGNIVITASALLNVYTITNTLTNVSNSNNSESINHGNPYSATLSPASGYTMQSVSVTMNGVDVTSTVYNNGSISIASVTGDLIITATATNQTVYGVTNTLSHVTNSNSSVSVVQGDSYKGKLTADSHYELLAANVSVTMGGTDITSSAYSSSTGFINIASVTGALVITATATAITHTITNNLTDATNSNTAASINDGGSYSGTITPNSGYTITTATVTMGGTDITSTAYNNGTISIANVTGNIVITIVATPAAQITWYTNFSQNSTSSFVASSRGWALDETTYANIYEKPINRISLVATANSGSIDLCIAPSKDAQSGFTNQQTINWTSANKSGNIVTLELANPITLSTGQYLCVYVNSTPATGAACYANGGNAGQFYSYVASAGHSTWGNKGSYSIQMNIGYYG